MNARTLAGAAMAVALIALGAVLLTGHADRRHVHMVMPSALGLREGSDVRIGGVSVGRVSHLGLTPDDHVKIDIDVDAKDIRLGRGASVTIKSVNLLGEKYVALNPGDASGGRLDDVVVPRSRVTTATDLDQVLDVLDADTRTRLAILINEAGLAMTGRHADFNQLLEKLPPSLQSATRLLDDVVADNHSLADVIAHSDRFLARTVQQRADLRGFIDSAAGAATTFAHRSDALRESLARSPAALSTLRGFLADLRTTATSLRPAARNISATAVPLSGTLAQLRPFRTSLHPTLKQATAVAPALGRLGTKAEPVIRRSVPTLSSLTTFADTAKPLTKTLGTSTPDLLGVLEGWGRAIQGRDSRGHAFHGGVTFGAGVLQTLLEPPATAKRKIGTKPKKTTAAPPPSAPTSTPHGDKPGVLPKVTEKVQKLLEDLPSQIGNVTQTVIDTVAGVLAPHGGGNDRSSVLDYLLKP